MSLATIGIFIRRAMKLVIYIEDIEDGSIAYTYIGDDYIYAIGKDDDSACANLREYLIPSVPDNIEELFS